MGRGLFLILCGVTGLRAEVCEGLPAAPPDGSNFAAGTAQAFRLTVKPGGPSFRITIQSLQLKPPPNSPFVHAGDIEVAKCSDGIRLQLLDIQASQSVNFVNSFRTQDVNFDGYLDFAVLAEFGGAWGSEWWWVYDPQAGKFVKNNLTGDLRALKAAEIRVDSKKHEIATRYLTEPWGCGSTGDRYRVVNGRLLIVHKEAPKAVEGGCRVTVSDRVGGVMKVTGVRRFNGPPP
jgi:hypothetical protein